MGTVHAGGHPGQIHARALSLLWWHQSERGDFVRLAVVAYEHSALEAVELLLQKRPALRPWRNRPYVLEALWHLEGLRAEWQRDFSATHTEANLRRGSSVETNLRHQRSNDAIRGCHKKSHRDVSTCVLHLHDKRCLLGIHESLLMIVTSFALRSPCSWQLQCEMYVVQFFLNLFSVASAPPHLSTFTSSHAHIRRSTSPPHHTHTSAHLYHICTSTLSLLHICPVFLSTYISLVSVHLHLRTLTSTDLPVHLHTSTHSISHLHIHTVTPSRPPFLSLFLYIFSTVLDNHMSRFRATRRVVFYIFSPLPLSLCLFL